MPYFWATTIEIIKIAMGTMINEKLLKHNNCKFRQTEDSERGHFEHENSSQRF